MDNKQWTKMARDAGLLRSREKPTFLTSTDFDLIFSKIKKKGERRIGFDQFVEGLKEASSRASVPFSSLRSLVVECGGPVFMGSDATVIKKMEPRGSRKGSREFGLATPRGSLSIAIASVQAQATMTPRRLTQQGSGDLGRYMNLSSETPRGGFRGNHDPDKEAMAKGGQLRGPARFFYDKSQYTGVHKAGGPSTVDSHTADLEQMVKGRQAANVRGVVPNKDMAPPDLMRHLSGRGSIKASPSTPRRSVGTPLPPPHPSLGVPPRKSIEQQKKERKERPTTTGGMASATPRGPARFFYDKNTYTGVHTRGGPNTVDTETADLKNIVGGRKEADKRGVVKK